MKYLALAIIAILILLIASVANYLGPDDLKQCPSPQPLGSCARADAIVAVSGGDTAARADEAIKLFQAGWAERLIFSGAAADPNGPSNAEAMARQAKQAGVSDEVIDVEGLSRDTAENARNTSQYITERSLKRIILVTSAYHQKRAFLEFRVILGDTVAIINHPVANDRQWVGWLWWTTPAGWWLAGSELIKILAFYSVQGLKSL